jgi:ferric enterobactin receptor
MTKNLHSMYQRLYILLWLVWGCSGLAQAQKADLSAIKMDKLYIGKLDAVLDELSADTGVKLSQIMSSDRPFNQPLDTWLTRFLNKYDLKWYRSTDGILHVIGKHVNPESDALRRRDPADAAVKPSRKNVTVKGTVIDRISGESLPYVHVQVAGAQIGGNTNVDGYFSILNVPTDTSTLVFTYLGYRPTQVYLSPKARLEALQVEMEPSGTELTEVVVTAEREDLLQTAEEVSMIKMSTAKIALLPSLGEKDIFRAFQLMPGVSAVNEQSAGLYVRGGTPDQVLTQFDGFTVYNVDHLFGFYSAFNANAIKDVQLYKSAFDAKYGGRLSSVVDITGKDGNNRQRNVGFDVGMLSANIWVEQPLGEKLTTIATFRRSWRGPIYNKIFEKFGKSTNSSTTANTPLPPGRNNAFSGTSVASWFYDMNFKTTWKPNKRDVFSLSFYNGKDELDNSQTPSLGGRFGGGSGLEFTDLTDWGNTGASLKWSARWNKRLYTNTLLSYSTYFSNRDRTTSGSIIRPGSDEAESIRRGTLEHNRLQDVSLRNDWEWKITDRQQLGFGLAATHNDIVYTFSQNDTSTILDRHNTGETVTGYLQDKLSFFKEKWTITPGIRSTWFSPTGKMYYEPRLSTQFQVTPRIKLKAAAGRYYQFVKRVIREDIFSGSRDFWVLADNNRLPVSSSDQYVAGISWENKNWLFDAEAYYKPLYGLSEYSLRTNPRPPVPGSGGGSIDYEENFFDGNGVARGIDFLLQKKYGRWNGWVGYTLGEVRHNFPAYGENDFYAANDVTHEFKMTHLFKWRRWDFSATWVYATGKPYTAPEGAHTVKLLDGTTQSFLNVSEKNAYRLPAYHRMDLAATYHFKLGKSPGSLNLSIFNAYNHTNVWYKQFEVIDNTLIESDVNYLGFTPNLTFSYKFR